MDKELEELMRELDEVQNSKQRSDGNSKQKLTEMNVIDVIMKVRDHGLVDFITNLSGKVLYTPQRLREDICREIINRNGGRMLLHDISNNLSIDLSIIKEQLNVLVKGSKDNTRFFTNVTESGAIEVISSSYLLKISMEINETLQEMGKCSIQEISAKYMIPVSIIQETIHQYVEDGVIIGVFTVNQSSIDDAIKFPASSITHLLTQQYINRLKRRVRGILTASTRICPSDNISSICPEFSAIETSNMLNSIVVDNNIPGKIIHSGTGFMPSIFNQLQRQSVESIFLTNGFIKLQLLEQLMVSNPFKFIQDMDSNCVKLSTLIVGDSLVHSLVSCIDEDCVAQSYWIDSRVVLPSDFTEDDCSMLINSLVSERKECHVIGGVFVCSHQYVKNIETQSEVIANDIADKAVECIQNPKMASQISSKVIGSSDMLVPSVSSSSSSSKSSNSISSGNQRKKPSKSSASSSSSITDELLQHLLQSKLPQILEEIDSKIEEELKSALIDDLATKVKKIFLDKTKKAQPVSQSTPVVSKTATLSVTNKKVMILEFEKRIEEQSHLFQMLHHGCEKVREIVQSLQPKSSADNGSDDSVINEAVNENERRILLNVGLELVQYISQHRLLLNDVPIPVISKERAAEQLAIMIDLIPEDEEKKSLHELHHLCRFDDESEEDINYIERISAFLKNLEKMIQDFNIMILLLDKKKEKNALVTRRQIMVEKLDESNGFSTVLPLSISLIIQQAHGAVINFFPPNAVDNASKYLAILPPAPRTLFEKYISTFDNNKATDNLKELQSVENEVKQLAKLKRI